MELSPKDKFDKKVVKELAENWRDTAYMHNIADTFNEAFKNSKFYIVKAKDGLKSGLQNIKSVIKFTQFKKDHFNSLSVEFLQSAPSIANKKQASPIKGAGELAMYEAVKYAKQKNIDDVVLYSTNDGFYDNFKLPKDSTMPGFSLYILKSANFDEFLDRIKTKYNL